MLQLAHRGRNQRIENMSKSNVSNPVASETKAVVEISYRKYLVSIEDAAKLVEIFARSPIIERAYDSESDEGYYFYAKRDRDAFEVTFVHNPVEACRRPEPVKPVEPDADEDPNV